VVNLASRVHRHGVSAPGAAAELPCSDQRDLPDPELFPTDGLPWNYRTAGVGRGRSRGLVEGGPDQR